MRIWRAITSKRSVELFAARRVAQYRSPLLRRHCERTATEVSPRTLPFESANWTKTRLLAGSNGTVPLPVTNIPKVGVWPVLIVVVALEEGVERHMPLVGLVWHTAKLTGRLAEPVLAVAVITPEAPTLTVATANAPVPLVPGISTIPGSPDAASATTSGTGVVEADTSSVLRSLVCGAASALAQKNSRLPKTEGKVAVGVSAMTKLCAPPGPISTGVLSVPVSALVAGSVV